MPATTVKPPRKRMPRLIRLHHLEDLLQDLADAQQGDVGVARGQQVLHPLLAAAGQPGHGQALLRRSLQHAGLDDQEEVDAERLPVHRAQAGHLELERHPLDVEAQPWSRGAAPRSSANSCSTLTSAWAGSLHSEPATILLSSAALHVGQPLLAGRAPSGGRRLPPPTVATAAQRPATL